MNKSGLINKLQETTGYDENTCTLINSVLESHNIIGHNNKDAIKADFVSKLNITDEEADKLYNTCMEVIVKGVFRRD